MSKIYKLPDESGCFSMTIGPREPGFINILKYHKKGYARDWLLYFRNFITAYQMSRNPNQQTQPMNVWECLCYSWNVSPLFRFPRPKGK